MRSKFRALPFVIFLLPFDIVVAASLSIASFWGSLSSRFKKRTVIREGIPRDISESRAAKRTATIVIVNWDGKHLLQECLPSVVEAVRYTGANHEILIVDNGSTDGSADFVRQQFPGVRVLPLDRNYGFGEGNNRGIAQVRTDIVVLLNNDMIVDQAFLPPLLEALSDPSVFAAASQVFFQDTARRREETGKTRARFENGFFYFWHEQISPEDENRGMIPVFWAGGGSCALDRRKFLEMGGFDSLYAPVYVEDTDLSYQAWKRGWKCELAVPSRVIHKHRSTSQAKFGNEFVDNLVRKHQYLFVWKNVTDASMILQHLLNLPRLHGRSIVSNADPGFEIRAYLRAIRLLPQAMRKRWANQCAYTLSDREVLGRSQKS
jgi:GT2 family glycosyltransferase